MVKAAALGIVDFKLTRHFDRLWWTRLNWLLNELEDRECSKALELKFTQHAGALSYLAGKEAFDHHWKQLNELFVKWLANTFSWLADKIQPASGEDLASVWKRAYGDPNSPEIQQRIQETADSLKAKRGPENDTRGQNTGWAS